MREYAATSITDHSLCSNTHSSNWSSIIHRYFLCVRACTHGAGDMEASVMSQSGKGCRHSLSAAQASSCSGKLRILRWAWRRYCCCLKYTLNAPLIATNAIPPCRKRKHGDALECLLREDPGRFHYSTV